MNYFLDYDLQVDQIILIYNEKNTFKGYLSLFDVYITYCNHKIWFG